MISNKARQGHRRNPGIAFKHLDQRILDGETQNRFALLAKKLRDRFEKTALAGPLQLPCTTKNAVGR